MDGRGRKWDDAHKLAGVAIKIIFPPLLLFSRKVCASANHAQKFFLAASGPSTKKFSPPKASAASFTHFPIKVESQSHTKEKSVYFMTTNHVS